MTTTLPEPADESADESTEDIPDITDPRMRGIAIEAKLREWNIKYTYDPDMKLADISVLEAAQVRSAEHIADDAQVEEYTEQMRNGAVFPPMVLQGDRLMLDGNSRHKAARKLRMKTFPVFHCEFPNIELGRTFAASINQQGGRRLSPEEAHGAALSLLKFGHTEESVARELGYSRTSIQNWKKEADFAARAKEARVDTEGARLSKAIQHKLADIKQHAPFAQAVELVAEIQPKPSVVTELVKAVKDAPSESDALAVVEAKRAELVPTGPPPARPAAVPPELARIRRSLPNVVKDAATPSLLVESEPSRREAAVKQWEVLHDLVDAVLGLYRAS
jgi:ParB-like chromosome segregation protein Spo0J